MGLRAVDVWMGRWVACWEGSSRSVLWMMGAVGVEHFPVKRVIHEHEVAGTGAGTGAEIPRLLKVVRRWRDRRAVKQALARARKLLLGPGGVWGGEGGGEASVAGVEKVSLGVEEMVDSVLKLLVPSKSEWSESPSLRGWQSSISPSV